MHAAMAAAFFFVLDLVVLKSSLDSAIRWAVGMAGFAALLAWQQSSR